jgi:hypothetical protein
MVDELLQAHWRYGAPSPPPLARQVGVWLGSVLPSHGAQFNQSCVSVEPARVELLQFP